MIRHGDESDIEDIVRMAEEFWGHTVYEEEFQPNAVRGMARECIRQELMVVYDKNGVKGFACGLCGPLLANHDVLIGVEVAWWMDPDYRKGKAGIGLLKGLERAAKSKGIKYWNMLYMNSSMPETIKGIYQKMGYNSVESTYQKVL